jgi:hypothetical protein
MKSLKAIYDLNQQHSERVQNGISKAISLPYSVLLNSNPNKVIWTTPIFTQVEVANTDTATVKTINCI